jgi:hypothetical protein
MAQERTLGIAKATPSETEEPSKEELQRRMEEAREDISSTVNEIKETVAQQVETVKDALDWREHFRKQPVAWSLGALGVGLIAGYGVAAAVKGDSDDYDDYDYTYPAAHSTTPSPAARGLVSSQEYSEGSVAQDNGKHEGPGLFERFKESSAYDRLSREASSLGDRFIEELSNTAHTVVLPLVLSKVKNWIGLDLSNKTEQGRTNVNTQSGTQNRSERNTYQPVLERPS